MQDPKKLLVQQVYLLTKKVSFKGSYTFAQDHSLKVTVSLLHASLLIFPKH